MITSGALMRRSLEVRNKLEEFQHIKTDARVLEVGSGAHGLIFSSARSSVLALTRSLIITSHFFPTGNAVFLLYPHTVKRFPSRTIRSTRSCLMTWWITRRIPRRS